MSDQFKIDENGNCPSCNKISAPGEHVKCYSCNKLVHVICSGASNDEKVATKTMINGYLTSSTKRNFVFYCDKCLTELEISKTQTESKRIENLEKNMFGINNQLSKIMELLSNQDKSKNDKETIVTTNYLSKDNIWSNSERLANVKAPEPKSVLIINKDGDSQKNIETQNIVEKIVVDNDITLAESHKRKDGDLVLVCKSEEERNELKNLVEIANMEIQMNAPKSKQASITLVGLSRAFNKDELMNMILRNEFIKTFSIKNKIEDHIKIHVIKPLRNKPTVYQAFASVSPILREGIREHQDKIIIGLIACKVYDRKQTRRCNNCQLYGHFAKNCPTSTTPVCGKCSENHRTDQCNQEERKCINCVRNNHNELNHPVFYHKCPVLVDHIKELQNDLNLRPKKILLGT